jgi:FtsP/CotA-like multicopper oxidase with cupredoxin domain
MSLLLTTRKLTTVDLGTYPVTDWFSRMTIFEFASLAEASLQKGQAPPPADSVLINGTTKGPRGGVYSQTPLTKGKKYRLRLINTSLESTIRVSLDNHPFLVIAADFVPVKPFTVSDPYVVN